MSQLAKYAFANAKIRAMLSRLLEPGFYDTLLAARSYSEAVNLLRKTPYEAVIPQDRDASDILRLEKALGVFDEQVFRKVSTVLLPAEKQFVLLLLEKFEIEAVKVALRIWHRKLQVILSDYLPDRRIVHPLDYAKIVNAKSIEELIVVLAETPYFRPLARARERFKAGDSLFYLEASLDVDYYQRVIDAIGKFSPSDKGMAMRVLGVEIDIENVNWLVRLRKFYNLAMGDMVDWVIPGGERVTKETVRKTYTSDGLGNILDSIAVGPYTKISGLSEDMYLIESFLYELLLKQVKRALAGFPFSIGTVLGYLILKRRETRNIITILNAKQLGMKKEAVSSLITI